MFGKLVFNLRKSFPRIWKDFPEKPVKSLSKKPGKRFSWSLRNLSPEVWETFCIILIPKQKSENNFHEDLRDLLQKPWTMSVNFFTGGVARYFQKFVNIFSKNKERRIRTFSRSLG